MSNELTHGLAGASAASVLNAFAGNPIITPNIFLAGMLAMLINLDRGGSMSGKRTPYGHSAAFGILWLYLATCIIYLLLIFDIMALALGIQVLIAFGAALFTHLALDAFSEEGIFLFPQSLFSLAKQERNKDWHTWKRLSLNGVGKKSGGELNIALVSVMMAFIALA